MLTKKECEKALDHLEKCYWDKDNSYGAMNGVRKDLDILNKLIHEHFDNPPLKYSFFEESLDINLVFDKKFQAWRLAVGLTYGKEEIHFLNFGDKEVEVIPYEPNRFYRKEVQE